MLVVCNGMIRSGSTLQYNITRVLVELLQVGVGEGYFESDSFMELREQIVQWAADSTVHVIKTHIVPRNIIDMNSADSVRVFYIYRDLRDVAASAKSKWGYEGKELFNRLDMATATYKEVLTLSNVLIQKYEDVVLDMPASVRAVAAFLGIEPTDSIITSVTEECSLESAKKTTGNIRSDPVFILKSFLLRDEIRIPANIFLKAIGIRSTVRRKLRNILNKYDKHALYHPDHISKNSGAIGKWRLELSDYEIEHIIERYKSWFSKAGYSL